MLGGEEGRRAGTTATGRQYATCVKLQGSLGRVLKQVCALSIRVRKSMAGWPPLGQGLGAFIQTEGSRGRVQTQAASSLQRCSAAAWAWQVGVAWCAGGLLADTCETQPRRTERKVFWRRPTHAAAAGGGGSRSDGRTPERALGRAVKAWTRGRQTRNVRRGEGSCAIKCGQ